jgi:hypothetical protein
MLTNTTNMTRISHKIWQTWLHVIFNDVVIIKWKINHINYFNVHANLELFKFHDSTNIYDESIKYIYVQIKLTPN